MIHMCRKLISDLATNLETCGSAKIIIISDAAKIKNIMAFAKTALVA